MCDTCISFKSNFDKIWLNGKAKKMTNMYEYDTFENNNHFPVPSKILTDEYFEQLYLTKTFWEPIDAERTKQKRV